VRSKASLIPRETQIGSPSPQQVLDDRDLLDMFPGRIKQCEAQADRTDRLAHTEDVAAACHPYWPSPIAR
jgi:hypothetical protein